MNPLHPRMLCAMFGWNWPIGSREKRFLNIFNIILLFRYYLPLEKGVAFHLKKFESLSTKNALCQVSFKLAKRFWWRRFLNILNRNLLFRYYPPWRRAWPFIWTNLKPLHPRMRCAKFGWIGQLVLKKDSKMWKDGQTENRQQAIRKAHFSP